MVKTVRKVKNVLKVGDKIIYDDGVMQFEAIIINVTSTTKAHIKALTHVDEIYNPNTCVNTYRKYMTKVV